MTPSLIMVFVSVQIPKYAFVAKEFLEPERIIQFRVSWLDDSGTYRMNRGFRVQVGHTLDYSKLLQHAVN